MSIKSPRRALGCQQRRPASSKELPTLGRQLLQINAQPLREIQATWECAVHAMGRILFPWLCQRHQNFPGPQDLSISESISFFTSSLINHQHRLIECLLEMSLQAQWLCSLVLEHLGYRSKGPVFKSQWLHSLLMLAAVVNKWQWPKFLTYEMERIMVFVQ